nr:FAD-linked oxidoreductase [Hypoxylon rubiginosum]
MFFKTVWQKIMATTAAAAVVPDVNELFGPYLSPGASIYLASDANYTAEVTQRWSDFAAPSYIATIKPAIVDDVQNIVKIASSSGIPFLVTGGGHGVSIQMEGLQGGIQVDLSNFNSVQFDQTTALLTVGGSAKFSQLIDPTYKFGYQFPLGTAHCVGVVGATLGAGISGNQGYMGLLIDLLEEAQVVTSTGDVVTASRRENPDLFWALRGAGANFGIVTSATYTVPKTPNNGNVTNASYLFQGSKAREVYEYLATLDDDMSAFLALNIVALVDPNSGQVVVIVNANFAGPVSVAKEYLAPLEALGPLRSEMFSVAWPDVASTSFFGIEDTRACSRNQHVNMRSVAAKRTDPQVTLEFITELDRFTKANPDVMTTVMIHRFPTQKVLGVSDEDSVYPHRDLKMHIQLESEYDDYSKDSIVSEFLDAARRNFTAASGYDEPAVYVNFAHGDEGPAAWYGARNLGKLGHLKQKWDPQGLFNFYDVVPMASSSAEL